MKALIIEDSPDTVESISLVFRLRWPDVTLLAIGSGKQGIEMVERESPDIVILDIGLPDMNGFVEPRQSPPYCPGRQLPGHGNPEGQRLPSPRKLTHAGASPDIIAAETGVGYRLNPPE